jgi:microcin C transport system ATP-binding protein
MSCREIVLEGLEVQAPNLSENEKASKLTSVLLEVGLDETFLDRFPHELSGGERQRLAIARALILEPKVLVLDEPTTALDRALQFQVLDLLKKLQAKRGMTMLYISHDLALVKVFTHRVMVLDQGRCVEVGLTKDLFTNPQTPYLKRLLATTFTG